MKAKPIIAMLLGCLIMVIMGHNIVPHHHHFGTGYSFPDCEQHNACNRDDAGMQTANHAGKCHLPSGHCHAFNGLEFIPKSEESSDPESFTASIIACRGAVILKDKPLPREINYYPAGGAPPDFEGFLGESAGLRAPPVI